MGLLVKSKVMHWLLMVHLTHLELRLHVVMITTLLSGLVAMVLGRLGNLLLLHGHEGFSLTLLVARRHELLLEVKLVLRRVGTAESVLLMLLLLETLSRVHPRPRPLVLVRIGSVQTCAEAEGWGHSRQVVVVVGEAPVLIERSMGDELLPAALSSTVLVLKLEFAKRAAAL